MGILEQLRNRVETFNEGLTGGTYIGEIIQNNDWEIIGMNTDDQLYEQGITATGISIADYEPYSETTIEIKQMKGQPTDRVTLRDSGDFHHSFEVETDNVKMTIVASDFKTIQLLKRYGNEIMGLTQHNIERFEKETLLPELMIQAQKTLFTL